MRLLTFCPYLSLTEESVQSVLSQTYRGQNDIMLSRDNPHGDEIAGSYKNIQLQYEKMRTLVLERYDKVWIVESDIIAPRDALEKLLEVKADVVTGLYKFRQYVDKLNIFNTDLTLMKHEEMRGKTVIPCGGGAMGCVLIDRKVFEGFTFIDRYVEHATDAQFMRHCVKKQFSQVARLDVVCGHKTAAGILWPEVN